MKLYTERNNMREAVKETNILNTKMYSLLFDACLSYLEYLAWKFPEDCPDDRGTCGTDVERLINNLTFDIPTLYGIKDSHLIKPSTDYEVDETVDQFALLDLIEYFAQNLKDISNYQWHSWYSHNDLGFAETSEIFKDFQIEINSIFKKTGLLFKLTNDEIIERIISNDDLNTSVEQEIADFDEQGIKELLEQSISLHKSIRKKDNELAVEKIWDAFERVKTYFVDLDKRKSAEKVIGTISDSQKFVEIFNDEFNKLTEIGNDFRIRHHETNKVDIDNLEYYDYFFNRCLSLIGLIIQRLNRED